MRVIHIMADGTIRDSVDGLVIKSPQFYQVLSKIQQKKNIHKEKRK